MIVHNSLIEKYGFWKQEEVGYFAFGVPAVFLDSRCILPDTEQLLSAIGKLSESESISLKEFRVVEAFVTAFHELKHFHDSMLNPMLFSLYGINVSENYIRWVIIEAIQEDPKLTVETAIQEVGGKEYIRRLRVAKDEYRDRFGSHQQPILRTLDKATYSFSIQTFFELSAFVHEVIAVIFLAGEKAGLNYFKNKSKYSNRLYTHIFEIFFMANKNIHRAIDMSLTFFDLSLCSPVNPMNMFLSLVFGEFNIEHLIKKYGNILTFCREAVQHQSSMNIEIPLLDIDKRMSMRDINLFRERVIEKRLYKWELRSDRQYVKDDEMVTPPVYFFSNDEDFSTEQGRLYLQSWLSETYGNIVPLMANTGGDGNRYVGSAVFNPTIQLDGIRKAPEDFMASHQLLHKTDDMIFSQWCIGRHFGNPVETTLSMNSCYSERAKQMGLKFASGIL